MEQFCNNLNQSPWRGVITETGIGLEFSSRYLRVPGASKTIQGVNSPYKDKTLPGGMRAVSLENAKRLAELNLAQTSINANEDTEHLFGLAITGAHYEDRPSHGWIYIATPKWNAYMHFSVSTSSNREWVGSVVSNRVQWFINACMLSNSTWVDNIRDIEGSLERHNIDVIYAPGLSNAERLMMLKPMNPLVYHDNKFHRVVDYVREFPRVYPGAFNPPTRKHLNVDNCLFEITQQHCYKGGVSIEDMLHRMRMLNAEGKPVLITQAPRFIDKRNVLKAMGAINTEFVLGADAWNIMISEEQYPTHTWLKERLPNTMFVVLFREGMEINENRVSDMLVWEKWKESDYDNHNSTAVRESSSPSTHKYLTPSVAKHVKNQELYLDD